MNNDMRFDLLVVGLVSGDVNEVKGACAVTAESLKNAAKHGLVQILTCRESSASIEVR